MSKYQPEKIEKKWQEAWEKEGIYQPDLENARKPFYNLMMFPYPSAEGMHVGNMYAFTGSDIYGRFKRMQGFNVFEPIGLDGFGIHSENYALKIGEHPATVARRTEKNFYRQLKAIGNSYAWENKLETYDPDYYKWTQWLFIQMFNHGLAVRKKAPVNWCPSCKTVLADEQVIGGECERCGEEAVQKELEQWFFKITDYADKLLENLDWIDWSERIKVMQRNWIGRSKGVEIEFKVENSNLAIPVFTTRPDTAYGATFIVLAPEHNLVGNLKSQIPSSKRKDVEKYVEKAKKKSELERTELSKEKTGVFTGSYAINPFNNEKVPIFVADFVVMSYGTGAVMGVPGHDQRDWDFAKKYGLEIREVVSGGDISKGAYEGEGKIVNSGRFSDLGSEEAINKIGKFAEEKGFGEETVNYKLRDWCISRQRYWGPPIPMIHCPECGWLPVPEQDLPVKLPYVEDYRPKGLQESPLAQVEDWVNVKCPECGGPAERETDVSDTFLDSAWYFLRYPSVHCENKPFDEHLTRKWLPVDMYIGGAEHAVLHLLYTRFITMALNNFGYLDFEEPFKSFFAHGLITKDGAKMSKSRGNVVIPDEYIKKLGADTLRIYLMFLGPFSHGGDFTDAGIMGVRRFLERVWELCFSVVSGKSAGTDKELKQSLHRLIKKVGEDIESRKYNTAIAAMMEFINSWSASQSDSLSAEDVGKFLKLLAPFAPHITEELYQRLRAGNSKYQITNSKEWSIHEQQWPEYDPELVERQEVIIAVQVDGKLRGTFQTESGIDKEDAVDKAKALDKVNKHLSGKEVKKVIWVEDRLLNFVI